jgi:signal transduction histidine kinase
VRSDWLSRTTPSDAEDAESIGSSSSLLKRRRFRAILDRAIVRLQHNESKESRMPDGVTAHGLRVEAENRVLHRVIEVVSSSLDLDSVLRSTVELVTEATGGDVSFVHLWDPERNVLVLRATSEGFRDVEGAITLRLGEGIAGWVAEHREAVVIPENKWADSRYKYIPELRGELFESMLSVPMVSPSDGLAGVFNVHSRERREFSDREVEFLKVTASLLAVAIERATLFQALGEKEAALETLVRGTIEAQEEERRRVATEIHDGVTQQLVSVGYHLHALHRHLHTNVHRAEAELEKAQELVDRALDEARVAIHDLRPTMLDDLGLAPSIRALTGNLCGELRTEVRVDDRTTLQPHEEIALYRITQEALTNVVKHSGASSVHVALIRDDGGLVLRIADDGKGFDVSGTGRRGPLTSFGLAGIAERVELLGGRLTVRSRPGEGTEIEVRLT